MPTKPKPKLDPAVEAFYNQLLEKASLSDAEIDLLHTLLGNEKVATEFKSGVHARNLTDRDRDEIKKERKKQEQDYTRKLQELETLQRTLATTASTDTKKIANLEAAISAKEAAIVDRETKLRKLYETVKTYQGGDQVLVEAGIASLDFSTPSPKETNNLSNPSNPPNTGISKDDLMRDIHSLFSTNAQVLGKLPFDLMRFSREYKSLTGKDFDESEFYEKVKAEAEANQGRVDYHQVYLKEYDIENLREQQKIGKLRADIEKEYQDKLEMEISKRLAPSSSNQTKESPFYKSIASTIPEAERQSPVTGMGISDRSSLIAEAVNDFNKQQATRT